MTQFASDEASAAAWACGWIKPSFKRTVHCLPFPPHYKTSCVATCVNFFQRFPLGCGGMRTLTKLNGSIESPNKPCSYGGEQDCHWSIQPNSSSPIETIWMWFEGVNLAYDGHGDRHCG